MGLAVASALIVLVASGAVVSRLGSDGSGRGPSGAAGQALESGSGPAAGSTTAGNGAAGSADASGALSSASAPVPPPVPAPGNAKVRTGRSAGKRPAATSGDRALGAPAATTAASGEAPTASGSDGTTPPSDGAPDGNGSPPGPQGAPDPSAVRASASVGEGDGGAVAGVGLGENPDADLTVGTTPVLGDAPPSHGTGIGLGGRFLQPPPTIPILP